jgi:ankyrin repeat protein
VQAEDADGETALHRAASHGYDGVLLILLAAGADAAVKRKDGATALHCAASHGNVECVKILLEKGDKNANDINKVTPLMMAAWHGHNTTVQMLLDAGAKLWLVDNMQRTAIDYARNWKQESTLAVLLDADKGGPLLAAVSKGDSALVEQRLQDGADVLVRTEDGETALHRAADGGHDDVAKILLSWGVNLQAKTDSGATALHRAAYRGYANVVETLLKAGIDITAKKDGWTALHSAAQYGHLEVLKSLLDGSKKFLSTADSEHILSPTHHNLCSSDPLKFLKCLINIYPRDALLHRGLANEYFRRQMYTEAREAYNLYARAVMEEGKLTQIADLRHFGYSCDGCGMILYGINHKCIQCGWLYDACENCFSAHSHSLQDAILVPADNLGSDQDGLKSLVLSTWEI